jgi:hypothetical protein
MGQVLDSLQPTKNIVKDTIYSDTTKVKKNFFSSAIYNASDTVSIDPKLKKITLYNNARLEYGDMEITYGKIVIDY